MRYTGKYAAKDHEYNKEVQPDNKEKKPFVKKPRPELPIPTDSIVMCTILI